MLENSEKRGREDTNNNKKKLNRINSIESSAKKRKETGTSIEKNKNQPELWSKVIGRKEKRQNAKEEVHRKNGKEREKDKVKKRKPLRIHL